MFSDELGDAHFRLAKVVAFSSSTEVNYRSFNGIKVKKSNERSRRMENRREGIVSFAGAKTNRNPRPVEFCVRDDFREESRSRKVPLSMLNEPWAMATTATVIHFWWHRGKSFDKNDHRYGNEFLRVDDSRAVYFAPSKLRSILANFPPFLFAIPTRHLSVTYSSEANDRPSFLPFLFFFINLYIYRRNKFERNNVTLMKIIAVQAKISSIRAFQF